MLQESSATVELNAEQRRVIEIAIESGRYDNSAQVVDKAFELFREQLAIDDWMLGQKALGN